MGVKRCCWGECKSDNRHYHKPEMKGVTFLPFPKPKTQYEKCLRWIALCGQHQSQFNVSKIKEWTYICLKHFVGGTGPTDLYPDPIPASQVGSSSPARKKARKPRGAKYLEAHEVDHSYAFFK